MSKSIYLLALLFSMASITLFNFNSQSELDAWQIENDTVMGGKSNSDIMVNSEGNAVFSGHVTTENNGGFAQVKHECQFKGISELNTISLRLKGDGKKYQFRLKEKLTDRHSFIYNFDTSGDWETIEIPVDKMEASFRGRMLDLPNFEGNTIEEIAFLIGNGKKESFEILIDKIEMR